MTKPETAAYCERQAASLLKEPNSAHLAVKWEERAAELRAEVAAPFIVCAAIVFTDGLIVAGPRHFDRTMHCIIEKLPAVYSAAAHTQGFIDQRGAFYTREEAYVIADKAGQIRQRVGGDDGRLFSENLY